MLEMSRFSLLMYPPETVFAEKLEGIVTRGMLNSRMKDYYDLSVLIHDAMLKQASTKTAISRTFGRRKTHPSSSCPSGLSDEFEEDTTKNRQWNAFLRKHSFVAPTLSEVVRSSRVYVRVQPPPIGKKGLFDEF